MDRGAGLDAARLSADKLRAHVELLREQASELEAECYQLRFHPRYAPLIVDGPLGVPVLVDGPREAAKLDAVIESLRIDVERLASDEAITIIRETLHAYREPRQAEARAAPRRRILAYEAGAATRRSQLGQSQSVSSVSSGRCSSAAVPPGRSAGHGLSPAGFAAFHSC